ncbi:MAG TPA: hypothetical protein DIU15_20295 [Deltaproteobacteria bacterium]|nr:hypothetical protein [Deltaproteobacteria bacterium]HCP48390.1 hypothetical protein [Deltaproteobacteria bacterium]
MLLGHWLPEPHRNTSAASGVLLMVLLGACGTPGVIIDSYDDRGESCSENSAPAIANIELDSGDSAGLEGAEDVGWLLALHFDWQDPNPAQNPDPQNMLSGLVSINLLDLGSSSFWIDETILKDGCRDTAELCSYLGFGPGATGCAGGTAAECTNGQITAAIAGTENPIAYNTPIFYELRVRDACGAVSSLKTNYETGPYFVGSGRVEVPDAGESEDDTDSADSESDSESDSE